MFAHPDDESIGMGGTLAKYSAKGVGTYTSVLHAANESFGGLSMEVDGVTRHHQGWKDWQITTVLDNTRYMDKVQKAIQCHRLQLSGYGPIGG